MNNSNVMSENIISEKCKQPQKNCANFLKKTEGPCGKIDKPYAKTSLNSDLCYKTEHTKQSVGPANYMLSNFYHCDCDVSDVIETATENPYMVFKDGYGVSDCNIDQSNNLRVGKVRKYPKCRNQLFERPYLTVPFMGRGSGNAVIETKLLPGEDTSQKRQCNTLSGITINNYFTPLVNNLKDNVQKPDNLIQEVVDRQWTRGGVPSRQFVKDIDYLERCGHRIQNDDYLNMKFRNN